MNCIYCNSTLVPRVPRKNDDHILSNLKTNVELDCPNCPKKVIFSIENEIISSITIISNIMNYNQYCYAFIDLKQKSTTVFSVNSISDYEMLLFERDNTNIINPYNFDNKIKSIKMFM